MKILITGASGFIGQHIVERLKEKYQLLFLVSDLREHEQVLREVRAASPDMIVHLAALTEVEDSFYRQTAFSDVNYTGTVNLIEAAKGVPNLKNFVFASTMEVYGWQPVSDLIRDGLHTGPLPVFDETTPPNPNAPYAVAKYGCEKYLEYASRAYNFPYTILRQTNAYGRKDNDFFVTEQIITQMLANPDSINLGYAKPCRNFLFIDDLVDAWELVIDNPDKAKGELFCLGPSNALSIEDYANMIATKLNWTGTINWDTKPKRPGEIYLLNSSCDKIKSKLGWEPKVNLSDGIDMTIEMWR